jgi:prepilin-type N-terminal cleavage/methylation domain-containing protein
METEKIKILNSAKKNSERGFSLVELMLVAAISSIAALMIFGMFVAGGSHAHIMDTQMATQDSARIGLQKMLQEVRETAPSHVVNLSTSALVFQIPTAVDANGNMTWSGNIQYTLGGVNNRQLLRTDASGTVSVMANDVYSLSFTGNTPLNPSLITVQVEVRDSSIEGRGLKNLITGQAEVRNA